MISLWFNSSKIFLSSLFAPTKFVPLSLHVMFDWPSGAMNRHSAKIKESVLEFPAISKCTTLAVKHVNNTP